MQYIEDMDDAINVPDFLKEFEKRKLSNVTSPISLYILKDDGELSIIAIQQHPIKGNSLYYYYSILTF